MINCAMMCLLSATENSDENLHHSKQSIVASLNVLTSQLDAISIF